MDFWRKKNGSGVIKCKENVTRHEIKTKRSIMKTYNKQQENDWNGKDKKKKGMEKEAQDRRNEGHMKR